MALLDFQQQVLGRNKIWGATAGSADLPTTGQVGDWTVGDVVMNLNLSAIGSPAAWQCVAVTTAGNPTFGAQATLRGTTAVRTVVPPYTVSASDNYILSPAGAITLPASTSFPGGEPVSIRATASSVTITPASGQINGAAAVTLTSGQTAVAYGDGTTTNWYTEGLPS